MPDQLKITGEGFARPTRKHGRRVKRVSPTVTIRVELPRQTNAALVALAHQRGITRTQLILRQLTALISKNQGIR